MGRDRIARGFNPSRGRQTLDEDHFIVPPCVFFGNPCIDVDVRNALRGQLDVLDAAGVIDEPVATALDKIVN